MEKRIIWSAGAIAFFVASILAIFEVQGVMMPTTLFNGLVIVFIIGLVIGIVVMAFTVIHWTVNRGKALEFVGEWYCHYNKKVQEVSIHGAADLWSSAIIKQAGSITKDNGTRHYLNPQPIQRHFSLSNRYCFEFRDKDISISSEKVNIKIDIWLRNGLKKTLDCELPVTVVGQCV